MGLLRETLMLSAGRLVSLLAGIAASLILARRLSPSDYAVYQYATRKLVPYANIAIIPFAYWAYRYIARSVRGAGTTFLIITSMLEFIALLAAILVLTPLTGNILLALALAACITLLSINIGLITVTPARDARIASISLALRASIYSSLVILEWYARILNLATVSAACIVASLASDLVMALSIYDGTVCKRCARDWLYSIWVPLISVAASLIWNLDATIAIIAGFKNALAAFFATSILVRLAADLTQFSLRRIEAYTLEVGEYRTPLDTMRLAYTITAFAVGYALAQPVQLAAIAGREYTLYAPALPLIALSILVGHASTTISALVKGVDKSMADRPGRLLKLDAMVDVASATFYLAVFTSLIMIAKNNLEAAIAWGAAASIASLAKLTARLALLPPGLRRETLERFIAPVAAYTILAALLTRIFTRPEYRINIIEHAMLMMREAGPSLLLYYAVLMLIDSKIRSLAVRAATHILSTRGGRTK